MTDDKKNEDQQQVLLATEAELMVDSLQVIDLPEYGSVRWLNQHENLEKLNMQAVLSASRNEDEFIKDFLVSSGKINLLLGDIIMTDVWKRFVFPAMKQLGHEPKTSIFLYTGLYHEVTVISLLESALFHGEAVESLDENLLDLIDFIYRKLMDLTSDWPFDFGDDSDYQEGAKKSSSTTEEGNNQWSCFDELGKQDTALKFGVTMKCLNILRYIIDQCATGQLPLSVSNRLLVVFDFPLLLVQIMDSKPWMRQVNNGKTTLVYVDTRWKPIQSPDDIEKMSSAEAQVWLGLYQLLMTQDLQRKYDFNSFRRSVFAKLRTHLTESVLDQLPVLVEFRRFIEHLSFTTADVAPPKSEIVIEQVPEIYDKIVAKYEKKWRKLAQDQLSKFFDPSDPNVARRMASGLANAYNVDAIEPLLMMNGDPPKCAKADCGKNATKRCSRCKTEWYCSRPCQVEHWKKHKPACDLIVNAEKEAVNN